MAILTIQKALSRSLTQPTNKPLPLLGERVIFLGGDDFYLPLRKMGEGVILIPR